MRKLALSFAYTRTRKEEYMIIISSLKPIAGAIERGVRFDARPNLRNKPPAKTQVLAPGVPFLQNRNGIVYDTTCSEYLFREISEEIANDLLAAEYLFRRKNVHDFRRKGLEEEGKKKVGKVRTTKRRVFIRIYYDIVAAAEYLRGWGSASRPHHTAHPPPHHAKRSTSATCVHQRVTASPLEARKEHTQTHKERTQTRVSHV